MMIKFLVCLLYAAFALCATAAAWSVSARIGSRRMRHAIDASIALLLLVPTLVFAWMGLSLRFWVGVGHAPWVLAGEMLFAHLGGLVFLARRREHAADWPGLPLCATAGVALALDASLFGIADLRARLGAAELQFEAGRIAYELRSVPLDPRLNAATTYKRVGAELFLGVPDSELSEWANDLSRGRVPDFTNAALLSKLERFGPALIEVRAATHLRECEFKDDLLAPDGPDSPSPVFDLVRLGQALALEGSLRVEQRDFDGAIDDVQALFEMSDHVARTPLTVYVIMAHVKRTLACEVIGQLLSVSGWTGTHLDRIASVLPRPLMDRIPDVLAMEEAWVLNVLGQFGTQSVDWFGGFGSDGYDALPSALHRAFLLEGEALGYRAAMAEERSVGAAGLAALVERRSRGNEERGNEGARHGLIARTVAGKYLQHLIVVRRTDARLELIRLASSAVAMRLGSGAWPASAEALGMSGARLAVDEQGVTLTDSDPAWGADAPKLRIAAPR